MNEVGEKRGYLEANDGTFEILNGALSLPLSD